MTTRGSPRRPGRRLAALSFGVAALGSALLGCLSVPESPAVMCTRSSDCDQSAGEVCQENVCWGNPPPGPFAAVVAPPSTRRDLVARELPQIAIPPDGLLSVITFEAPMVLSGRVTTYCASPTGCAPNPTASTITVSRDSQFQGGPGFKATVDVDDDAATFSIPVPGGTSGDTSFTVTVVLADAPQAPTGQALPKLVPPARLTLSMSDSIDTKSITTNVTLGGAGLPVISGSLTSESGQGMAGYRVSALGHWVEGEPATEVSSVSITDVNGGYAVILSDQLAGAVELVARPPTRVTETDPVAPTVHVASIDAQKSSQHAIVVPANLGIGTKVVVAVEGTDLGGTVAPVPGATVTVSGMVAGASANGSAVSYTLSDQQIVDMQGNVTLHVLDGADFMSSYRMSVIPPPSSTLGVLFDQPLPTPRVLLASRVELRGVITDSAGAPLANVTVTARPSLRFLWTLAATPQAFVAAVPAATTVTLESGEFTLWVDAAVENVAGDYDLVIEPPAAMRAPTYIKPDIDISGSGPLDVISLGAISLPDAAFVHGQVLGPDGEPVENAELRLYLVSTELGLCTQVAHAPTSCPIPAQLQGRNTSDAKGTVRLTLPR